MGGTKRSQSITLPRRFRGVVVGAHAPRECEAADEDREEEGALRRQHRDSAPGSAGMVACTGAAGARPSRTGGRARRHRAGARTLGAPSDRPYPVPPRKVGEGVETSLLPIGD